MDTAVAGAGMSIIFLFEVTLCADPLFDCFRNTSAYVPGSS